MRRIFSTAALLSVCMDALTCCFVVCVYPCTSAVVDTPKMLRIMYQLAVPDGQFDPSKYKPPLRPKLDPSKMFVSLEKVKRNHASMLRVDAARTECTLLRRRRFSTLLF